MKNVKEIDLKIDQLLAALLKLSEADTVCLLDSCGVSHLGSHFLIAGIRPVEKLEIRLEDPLDALRLFDEKLSDPKTAAIFAISYDFGLKLERIKSRLKASVPAPDIFMALFDCLIIHDYLTGKTTFTGNQGRFDDLEKLLRGQPPESVFSVGQKSRISSNFSRASYVAAIENVKEHIRAGDTYQTNLTQQFRAELPPTLTPQIIFRKLRNSHPAAFSAFLKRDRDAVISISPERFLKVESCDSDGAAPEMRKISVSPIKGTRPRGTDPADDLRLKRELLASEKDRAENIMIVDLMRNDIGRICRFGSVKVEKLCELEEHPTLFHLVSTIRGELLPEIGPAGIVKAVFPCGSITGAPKIRTMQIIDELETASRGPSMGAIGYYCEGKEFDLPNLLDMNVSIRTMAVRGNEAVFNVGGGIVIDSDPEAEFEESLLKAKAILRVLKGEA